MLSSTSEPKNMSPVIGGIPRTSATAERQAADTALRMVAELLSQTDDWVEVYVTEVDRRRVPGLTCEVAYTVVRAGK